MNKVCSRSAMKTQEEKIKELSPYIQDILDYDKYMQVKNFNHHWEYSIFEHCVEVAYFSYKISKFLKLDYEAVARGGMLHDFFLYNWKTYTPEEGLHGYVHPYIAYKNASEKFQLSKKEKDIIIKHMFPLTIKPPRYIESIIVCLVDKLCATKEVLDYAYLGFKWLILKKRKKIIFSEFIYSFLYIFLIFKMPNLI